MRTLLLLAALCVGLSGTVRAQGFFGAANLGARTHIGSLAGPLAGTNILGQMLGGPGPDSLQPVGSVDYHSEGGAFFSGVVPVPDVPAYQYAYAQLLVWDGTLWGAELSAVPPEQLGRTDIVRVLLTTGVFPDTVFVPRFTQSAIVPVPEPSTWALALIGFGILWFRRLAYDQPQKRNLPG